MPTIRHHLAALAILATATAQGQTIKTLGFDTTNNVVIGPTNTNALVFTNDLAFNKVAILDGIQLIFSAANTIEGGTNGVRIIRSPADAESTNSVPLLQIDQGVLSEGNLESEMLFRVNSAGLAEPNIAFSVTAGGTGLFGNSTTTRSNLFGAAGLSATITNGGLVFVFTNGILASTNAP